MNAQAPINYPDLFFIDGKWTKPSSASKITVLNSATEELFAEVAEAQEADINRAVAAARKAFDHAPWPRMPHAERAGYPERQGHDHHGHAVWRRRARGACRGARRMRGSPQPGHGACEIAPQAAMLLGTATAPPNRRALPEEA